MILFSERLITDIFFKGSLRNGPMKTLINLDRSSRLLPIALFGDSSFSKDGSGGGNPPSSSGSDSSGGNGKQGKGGDKSWVCPHCGEMCMHTDVFVCE